MMSIASPSPTSRNVTVVVSRYDCAQNMSHASSAAASTSAEPLRYIFCLDIVPLEIFSYCHDSKKEERVPQEQCPGADRKLYGRARQGADQLRGRRDSAQ